MARLAAASAWTTFVALAVGTGCGGPEAGPETAGSGGAGGEGTATTGAVSTGPTSGSGGQLTVNCDPPAEPGSIYERAAVSYDITEVDPVAMCKYRGEVMLIVNTAAV